MLLQVNHVTRYRYDQPVRGVVQSHRLTPTPTEGQRVLDWVITVTDGLQGGSFRDGAGDLVQSWSVLGPVSEIAVTVKGTVETKDTSGVLKGPREMLAPESYLRDTVPTRADTALTVLARSVPHSDDALGLAHALSGVVADAIRYAPGSTSAHTTAAEALALGTGVCQDHAHALIAVARCLDMPARYVSGYLHSNNDGDAHEAAHAWAEVFVPGLGWVGFDPANRCCPDERYIRLGSGLDAQDAAPIKGTARGPGRESLDVTVAIAAMQQ
jgi:transglutaminase-like putative cysteine protease